MNFSTMNCVSHSNITNLTLSLPYSRVKKFQPTILHNLAHPAGFKLSSSVHLFRSTTPLFLPPRCNGNENDTKFSSHGFKKDGSDENSKTHPTRERVDAELISTDEPMQDVTQKKGTAKIHDFCFGIPYGGIVLLVGISGFFIFKDIEMLVSGLLYGGSILALSSSSLITWSYGRSSLPFILGQAAVIARLLWLNCCLYTIKPEKKLFYSVYSCSSLAMLFFYVYVIASGGNPPSKKKKNIMP